MSYTIEDLLTSWGAWRNRGLHARPIQGAAMYTPGAVEARGSYRQVCQPCRGTGVDLGAVGSMVVRSSDPEIEALRKEHPCPACRARGYTSVSTMKADPGAIRRTGTGGMHVPLDEKPQEIADLEAAMDARLSYINRVVLVAKYVAFPRDRAYNPEMDGRKARVAWVNQAIRPEKISDGGYGDRLTHSKRVLAQELGLPLQKSKGKRHAD